MSAELEIRVLGPLELRRGGAIASLPRSRKTRMLLAYLALTGRPQRRARLCELLWDVADDPRGALRWSLSKLRRLVDDDDVKRIVADRQSVLFEPTGTRLDLAEARRVGAAPAERPLEELEAAEALFRGELCEGLELPDFDEVSAWLYAQREEARRLQGRLLGALLDRLADDPERAVGPARRLVRIDPLDEGARLRLISLLRDAGRMDEAKQQVDATRRMLEELSAQPSLALRELSRSLKHPTASAAPSPPPAGVPKPVSLFRTSVHELPLVGRDEERARLRGALDDAIERGALGAVLVTGEPGIGKSRLLYELRVAARERRGAIADGCAFEAERRRPFGPWLDALRRLAVPAASELLAEGQGEPASREAMFSTVAGALAERARERPLVLIFDDVQWLDESSAQLLHYAVRTLRRRPVLLAMAARSGELPDAQEVLRLIRGLRRERVLTELPIGALDPSATARLIEQVGPAEDAEAKAEASGGNPLYALELARAGDVEAPSLRQLVRDRVESLPPEARDVLRWAAVLGPAFEPTAIPALAGMDEELFLSGLDTLEQRALLSVPDAGPSSGELRFAHGLVHSVVYAELSEPRRRLMHARVARALAERGRPEDAIELARHAAAAGDPGRAARACLDAGRRCLKVFASRDALRLARRGLRFAEQLSEPERTRTSIELWHSMLSARRPQTGEAEVEGVLEELAERALDLGLPEHARLAFHTLSYLRWEDDRPVDAERLMRRAEEVSRDAGDAERAEALAEAARCLVLLERDLPEADAWLREASALARRASVQPVAIPDALGQLLLLRGELDEAEARLTEARELARRTWDLRSEARALENLTFLAIRRGLVIDALERAEELERRLERDHLQGSDRPFARALAAACRLRLGRPGAEAELERALVTLRGLDAKRRLGMAARLAAEVCLDRGDAAAARAHAVEALRCAEQMERPSDAALARVALVRAARALGDEEAAAEHLARLEEGLDGVTDAEARRAVEEVCDGPDRGKLRARTP